MSRTQFLDKTLSAAAAVAQQALFAETSAGARGLLQLMDARIKILTFLFILVLISFLHQPGALAFLYVLSLTLALFSRVPLGFFLKRVWLFVPLFSAAIVLPALLNVVSPGEPLWVLVNLKAGRTWGPYTIPAQIAVTREGVHVVAVFVSRVAASVSFAVLFTMTTPWSRVFPALRALLVPRVFVVTLAMTERYLFVLLRLIEDMYRARKSRTMRAMPASAERSWTASRIAVTFRKSFEMSEAVYRAMLSRGFHGEFPAADRFALRAADLVWVAAVVLFGCMLILFERGLLAP